MLKKGLTLLIVLSILVLVGLIAFLVSRYILLAKAVNQISRDNQAMMRQVRQGTQAQLCVRDEASASLGPIQYQLRFISPSQYVLEVVCFERPLEGIEFARYQLKSGVIRSGGSIGKVADQPADPMQLAVFTSLTQSLPTWISRKLGWMIGRRTIAFQDNNVVEQSTQEILPVWTGGAIRSNCQAFGYACCETKNQVGQDPQLTDITDCAGLCYATCSNRPLVLAFGADGGFDPTNRTVQVMNQTEVKFSYIGQAGTTPLKSVVISFGDGQKANLKADTSSVTHKYNCDQEVCRFDASITLIDNQNLTSPKTALTILQVIIKN